MKLSEHVDEEGDYSEEEDCCCSFTHGICFESLLSVCICLQIQRLLESLSVWMNGVSWGLCLCCLKVVGCKGNAIVYCVNTSVKNRFECHVLFWIHIFHFVQTSRVCLCSCNHSIFVLFCGNAVECFSISCLKGIAQPKINHRFHTLCCYKFDQNALDALLYIISKCCHAPEMTP